MEALDACGIRYLIVGGVAVAFHGSPRFTKDIDLLVSVDKSNAARLYECLKEFGAPVGILAPEEFEEEDFVFHFGRPPWRVDILTSIPGVDFEEAYKDRVLMPIGSYKAKCISKDWLIRAKKASGRPQDILDIEGLS